MSWLEDDDSNSRQSIKQILDQQEVCGTDSGTSRQQPSSTQGSQITTVSMPGFKLKLGQHRSSDPDLRRDLFKKDQHCFVTGERREDLKITPLIEVDAAAWGGANAVEVSLSRLRLAHHEAPFFKLDGPQNAIPLTPELHRHFRDGNFAIVPSPVNRFLIRHGLCTGNLLWTNLMMARQNPTEVRPLDISQPPLADLSWEIVVLRPDIFPAPLYTYHNTVIDLEQDNKEDPPEDSTEKAWACYNSDRFLRSCEPATGHAHMPPFKPTTLRAPQDRPSPLALIIASHNAFKKWAKARDGGFCTDATAPQTAFRKQELPGEGSQVSARELETLKKEMEKLFELAIAQGLPTVRRSESSPPSFATLQFWDRVLRPHGGSVDPAPGAPAKPTSLLTREGPPAYSKQQVLQPSKAASSAAPLAADTPVASSDHLNNHLFEKEIRRALYLLDQHCFISGDTSENLRLWNVVDRYSDHASVTRGTETFLTNLRLHHPDALGFSLSGLHNTLLVEPHLHRHLTETNAFIIIPSAHDRFRMLDALRTSNEAWQEELKWKPSQFVTRPLDISQPPFNAILWDIVVLDPSSFATPKDPFIRYQTPVVEQSEEAKDSIGAHDDTFWYEERAWVCCKYDHYLRVWDPIDADQEMPSQLNSVMSPFQHLNSRNPSDQVSTLALCVRANASMQAWQAKQPRPAGAQAKEAKKAESRHKDNYQAAAADGKEAALEMIAEQLRDLSDAILYIPDARADAL